jgi:hypothetical protein
VGEVGDRRAEGRVGGDVGPPDGLVLDLGKGTELGEEVDFGVGVAMDTGGGMTGRVRPLPAESMDVRPSNECDRAGATVLVRSSASFDAEEVLRNMPFLAVLGGVRVVLGGMAVGGRNQSRRAARASAGLRVSADHITSSWELTTLPAWLRGPISIQQCRSPYPLGLGT